MKILLTGATGLIGRALSERLFRDGHDLVVLARNTDKARAGFPFPAQFHSWNAETDDAPAAAFEGVDAVVHLAGEPVAPGRWTAERKKKIFNSRILGSRNLVKTMVALDHPPKVLVSASAIGFYGNRGDKEKLDEASGPGGGFLAGVCQSWENETSGNPVLASRGIRSVSIRTGVVLSREGGALASLEPLFRAGLGGPVGSGRQIMSWIHIDDLVSLYVAALMDSRYRGPINGVAPSPVSNSVFSAELARVLEKPGFFHAPAAAVKLVLGEMATAVLGGQYVIPFKAAAHGFAFQFSDLRSALGALLSADAEVFDSVQWIPRTPSEVFPFFSDAGNLERLTPPWLSFRLEQVSTPEMSQGTLINYRLKIHGFPIQWQSRIEDWKPGSQFVDVQLRGPYALWHHTHRFESFRGGTLLHDRIRFRLPFGSIGNAVGGGRVRSDVSAIFRYRHEAIGKLFASSR